MRFDQRCHGLGYPVLEVEHGGKRAVEMLCPQMRAGTCLDQLSRNSEPVSGPPHAAFEHVANAEFAPHLTHIDSTALVGKGRVAGDYGKVPEAAERGDDVLDHAIGEIFLLGIAAEIGEGQHSEGRRRRGRRLHRARPNQAVADTGHGAYPFLPVGSRAQGLAQRRYLDRQVAFLDNRSRPGFLHQFGLGNDLALGLGQGFQQHQTTLSDRQDLAVTAERAAADVENKRTEQMLRHRPTIVRARRTGKRLGRVAVRHRGWAHRQGWDRPGRQEAAGSH